MSTARITFDRGTLVADGLEPPGFMWDPRSGVFRAPAFRYAELRSWLARSTPAHEDDIAARVKRLPRAVRPLPLRPYQADALAAWKTFGGRGVVAMPTGSGKTRVALAAIAAARTSAVVLCPTRALVAQWRVELREVYDGPVGVASDGEQVLEAITVMTFESAYRHLDRVGADFGLLVVDEVHHFGGGVRAEALECAPALRRIGLTATAPPAGSAQAERIAALVGPTVYEISVPALVGNHLAPLTRVDLPVRLDSDEAAVYVREWQPYRAAMRAFFRAHLGADWKSFRRALTASAEGRSILFGAHAAEALAVFPKAKARVVASLLDRHASNVTLVFVASTADAYAIARDNLIPAITAETTAREREAIFEDLRAGRVRALVSARVLNEGIDLPDAEIAILVAGRLGARELIQRVGRILRPRPGKQAIAYALRTVGTVDETRSERSWSQLC